MTITEDKPADTEDTPTEAIVEVPRPVAVGDIVVKTGHPQIYDALVLHTETTMDGIPVAYVIGRREEGGEWTLIRANSDHLVRRDLAGDTPGYPEIGEALVRTQKIRDETDTTRREELDRLRAQALEATNTLAARNTQVRDQIISVADSYSWDNEEVDELLGNLGLDPVNQEWDVSVTLTATQTVTVTVTARNLDDAIEQVENDSDLAWENADRYDWEYDSQDVNRYDSGPA